MAARIITAGILLMLFTQCNTQDNNTMPTKDTASVKRDSPAAAPKSVTHEEKTTVCDTGLPKDCFSLINDRFVTGLLNKVLAVKGIDSAFAGVKRTLVFKKNKYAQDQTDTTVGFKADCDTAAYIASKSNSFLLFMSLQSARLRIGVNVGMPKDSLARLLHQNRAIPDIVKVTDAEENNEVYFFFKDNRLTRIAYNNLYVE